MQVNIPSAESESAPCLFAQGDRSVISYHLEFDETGQILRLKTAGCETTSALSVLAEALGYVASPCV